MFHRFHNCCQSFLFSHRHRLGLKRQMKKNAKMQDICNKETKTTVASLELQVRGGFEDNSKIMFPISQ